MAAEKVAHAACNAIDRLGKPVKVEAEIVHGAPVAGLIAASRSTTLLCVGDTGAAMHSDAWLGSTAKNWHDPAIARLPSCEAAAMRT